MLTRDELPGTRIVALCRVSDPYNDDGTSLDRQNSYLHEEIQKLKDSYDGELVESYKVGESASTMDRESLDEILEMAENDEFDILMVWALHRLSRANPWDTFEYLLKLRDHGIVVYSDRDGYFDWDDPGDAALMADRSTTAREWRNELDRGARENNRVHLSEGRWPYGPPPYGTVKKDLPGKDDHELVIKSGYGWVHEEIFERFLAGESPREVSDSIESLAEQRDGEIDPPNKGQVERILDTELLTGRLILSRTGEVVQVKDDLKQIDPETFVKVQEKRHADDLAEAIDFSPQEFPDFAYNLISRFGQEFVVENIEGIRWCCPKCSSIEIKISDTVVEYWNINLPKIYCKDCGYSGPSIRLHEIQEIDCTFPLVCSDCQRTGSFSIECIDLSSQEHCLYKYTCEYCGGVMIKKKHPNETKRAFQDSTNELSLGGGDDTVRAEPDGRDIEEIGRNPVETALSEVPESSVYDAIADWIDFHGPKTKDSRIVMLDTIKALGRAGPLKRIHLRDHLFPEHNDRYTSFNSMIASTVDRHYTSTPGIIKTGSGLYDFDPKMVQYLLEWRLSSEEGDE